MADRCANSAALGISECHGPLRGGRPCHRAIKQRARQHPYKSTQVLTGRPKLACSADSPHGSSNGHASTLPISGLNGVMRDTNGAARADVFDLVSQVANGSLNAKAVATQVRNLNTGSQKVTDLSDESSWGESIPQEEIVWAPGKTSTQVAIALQRTVQESGSAMAARVQPQIAEEVISLLPDARYNALARAVTLASSSKKRDRLPGTIAIITDVQGDDPVLEEARLASMTLGCYAYRLGSSSAGDGLSSLLPNLPALQSAAVVIVIARQEVALPAVVAGLAQSPVIVVPSGTKECTVANSPGVSAVSPANGVAAALFAARILKSAARLRGPLA